MQKFFIILLLITIFILQSFNGFAESNNSESKSGNTFLIPFAQYFRFPSGNKLVKIKNVALSQDNSSSKILIYLSEPLRDLPVIMPELQSIKFNVGAVYDGPVVNNSNEQEKVRSEEYSNQIRSEDFITEVAWNSDASGTKFLIQRQYYSPVNISQQNDPPFLSIEFQRNYFEKESLDLKPGIVKHTFRTVCEHGPVVANVLELDLMNENISLKVGLPDKSRIKNKESLTDLIEKTMAYAGINANYFDVKIGNPLGALITDGEWLVGPIYNRVAIGFTKDKKILIDKVKLDGIATLYRGFKKKEFSMFAIDGLNTPVKLYKNVGLFTPNWDSKIELPKGIKAAIVRDNCVKKIAKRSVKIPKDGFILIRNHGDISDLVKKRDCLMVSWNTNPDWSNVVEAISGGPYLIMGGEVYVDLDEEKFSFAKKDIYAPRTAIGFDKNHKLYLITVDGRKNGHSVGLTLNELAEFLKKINLQEAINLDGGGSTTLVVNGEVINRLSEHHQRKISNGLLIFYNEPLSFNHHF